MLAGDGLTAHLSQLGSRGHTWGNPEHLARPQHASSSLLCQQRDPRKGPGTEAAGPGPHLSNRWSRTQRGHPKETTKREDTIKYKGFLAGKVEEQQEEGRLELAKRLPRFCKGTRRQEAAPGWAAPGFRGPAHLARALGTGLIVQGEHLAIHHLPPLVVAVCRDRGDRSLESQGPPRRPGRGQLGALTLAHRAALPIRVERVGAGDGAVHR